MGDLTPLPRTYPSGVTSWIEVEQPDVDAAGAFYRRLFGWELEDVLGREAPQRFLVATLDGLDVASLSGPRPGAAEWSTFVAVDDVDAAVRRAADLGAQVLAPPADAGPGGRTADLVDPQGARIRLWQARRRLGAQLTNAPGSWNFSDLHTADPGAAADFYTQVFGWRVVDQGWATAIQVPGYGDHLAATTDPDIHVRQVHAPEGFADVIGGIARVTDWEAPHWHVTFTVADRDDAADTATRLGATVLGTSEDDWTRTARIRDPQGAVLTLSQFAPREAWE